MNPQSRIKKGKLFEKYISQQIFESGLGKSIRTPGSGSGAIKGDLFNNLDFLFECKNQKKLNWWKSIDQAKQQAVMGNYNRWKWALVVADPRTPQANPDAYAVIDFWQFLKLLLKDKEPEIKEPDREMKFFLSKLKEDIKQVEKRLP